MSKTRVLFVDRDGTLIEEPPDEQVDSIEKIRFMPGVFAALRQAQRAGYKLAMVTNQDGLGTESFPQSTFDVPHQFMLDAFSSQGVEFDAVFVCPHRKSDGCDCRKPKIKLVENYVNDVEDDLPLPSSCATRIRRCVRSLRQHRPRAWRRVSKRDRRLHFPNSHVSLGMAESAAWVSQTLQNTPFSLQSHLRLGRGRSFHLGRNARKS